MKRLLGLLLVMGMVGCGQKENAGNAVDPGIGADEQLVTDSSGEKSDPSKPNMKVATSTPTETVDPVAALEKLGAQVTLRNGYVLSVNLGGTQFTDAGLVHLKGLTKLEYLSLNKTKVTDAGIAELKQALPICRINK